MKKKENQVHDALLYRLLRPIITFLSKIIFTPKIIGCENIPKEGRIILAGNHTSNFDCALLISSTKRSIHFLAKKELWSGLRKIIFSHMGLIPVDRSKKNHDALEKSYEYLNHEKVIGIFPEGTTEKNRGLLPFKMGAVKMAKETNTKIVPFVIKGKYKLFSKTLTIQFLKPITVQKDLEVELKKLRKIIQSNMED